MLQIGKQNELIVVKKVNFGVYLAEDGGNCADRVLLPKKYIPSGCDIGSSIKVFLYKDSSDRLIATTIKPIIQLGECSLLKVRSTGKIGAFLDWGLEKDLFLPYKEQTKRVSSGDEVLVALYIDKSERLCATMKVYSYLKLNPPYSIGDMLPARVYNISPKYGIFIAVEDKYSGLIQKKEAQGTFCVGDKLLIRVVQIREDGRVDASPNEKAYLKIESDSDIIYKRIIYSAGVLPFDDHASPSIISKEFSMSKAAFKRAVGHLLKEKKIKMENGRIISL